ncbi:hypothetical protein Hokovirus_2_136 [Hokovirus HKV1]|uniref:Uncharacterized protein n=1 Tax=Hokovirus HKV1 TaxID=1977638 RepID=A0A1V0SFV9_9VIRU|nr:hypothetical protein Hokovirus_2_136 [Hokovirus HKV1]
MPRKIVADPNNPTLFGDIPPCHRYAIYECIKNFKISKNINFREIGKNDLEIPNNKFYFSDTVFKSVLDKITGSRYIQSGTSYYTNNYGIIVHSFKLNKKREPDDDPVTLIVLNLYTEKLKFINSFVMNVNIKTNIISLNDVLTHDEIQYFQILGLDLIDFDFDFESIIKNYETEQINDIST